MLAQVPLSLFSFDLLQLTIIHEWRHEYYLFVGMQVCSCWLRYFMSAAVCDRQEERFTWSAGERVNLDLQCSAVVS